MNVLAIDPGPSESAWVLLQDGKLIRFGKEPNMEVGRLFRSGLFLSHAICERIRSYGMPAGAELFETCEWSGRFQQLALDQGIEWHWMARKDVKMHLCGTTRAKDANIRQALIDRLGAPGTKKEPGATYGLKADCWAALAVAVTWWDQHGPTEAVDAVIAAAGKP
jgi:hypothetical protein